MKNTNIYLIFFLLILFTNAVYPQWEQISMPGSRGGAVYSICFKDSLMFAGIRGGVYVSSDEGEHWKTVNPGLPPRENSAIVTSLAANNKNIVAAFNEPGVYISSNNGSTWMQAEIQAGLRSTPLVLATDRNWIIGGYPLPFISNFQSTDNGISWQVINGISQVGAAAIQDSFAIVLTASGIFISSDFGLKWTNVNSHSIDSPSFNSSVAISGSRIIAGIGSYGGGSTILSSLDKGNSWNNPGINLNCNSINSVIISPVDSGNSYIFAATDSGVFRSKDNGLSWIQMNNGLNSKLIFSLAFKTSGITGNPVLYAGTGNGIFTSTDFGESWSAVGTPSKWIFTTAGTEIFAASSNSSYHGSSWSQNSIDNIFYTVIDKSTDNGLHWTETYSGYLDNNSQVTSLAAGTDENNNNIIYAFGQWYPENYGRRYGIIFKSINGHDWQNLNFDSSQVIQASSINYPDLFISTLNPGSAYDGGIFHSTNGGNSWIKVYSGFPTPFVRAFANDGNKIYAGGSNTYTLIDNRTVKTEFINSVIVSNGYDTSWTNILSPLDSVVMSNSRVDTISILTSLYAKGINLLVGLKAYNFDLVPYSTPDAFGGRLYHLIQNGDNWVIADTSFTGRSVFAFESDGNDFYAATDTGVYRSTDYGSTWNDISSGMKNIYVSSLIKSDNYLYANTINGIWKRSLSEITSVKYGETEGEVPNKFNLSQNYPNPFNPATDIEFQIPELGLVSLKIYNLLGEEVATIVNKELPAGNYKYKWDAGNLASGVYFYRLESSGYNITKKMILIK